MTFPLPSRRPRVVSLIASGTEIVAGLGMEERLVGRSHSCDFPPSVQRLPVLSSAKMDPSRASGDIDRDVRTLVEEGLSVYRVDVDALAELRPDVIVTQDHCEVCAVSLKDVEDALCALDLPDVRICSLQPRSLDDVRTDIRDVAEALGVSERGRRLVEAMDGTLEGLRSLVEEGLLRPRSEAPTAGPDGKARFRRDLPRIALVEWLDPPMVAGHWMPELARIAGAEPVLVTEGGHSPTVEWADIADADPDLVVLMPCGFAPERTMEEIDADEVVVGLESVRAYREGRWAVVDGQTFMNRPSHRLAESAELLAAAVHGDALPELLERYSEWLILPQGAGIFTLQRR